MALKTVASAFASIGSLIVKRDGEGKTAIALVPLACIGVLALTTACYFQTQEPFSVCVKTVWTTIGGSW